MARPSTIARVRAAVLDLATEQGPGALTMEGIAARAGVGKQTLYRSWRTVTEVLLDALLADGEGPDDPDVGDGRDAGGHPDAPAPDGLPAQRVTRMLLEASEEIGTEPRATLLRALAASIQTDAALARTFHERLLQPQLAQVHALLASCGLPDPARAAELLLAPVLYRWTLRLPPLREEEVRRLVDDVLAITARVG